MVLDGSVMVNVEAKILSPDEPVSTRTSAIV
jgi:hypothetical protein